MAAARIVEEFASARHRDVIKVFKARLKTYLYAISFLDFYSACGVTSHFKHCNCLFHCFVVPLRTDIQRYKSCDVLEISRFAARGG